MATGNRPAASVRHSEWKLIPIFHDGLHQTDRFELYNLMNDIGETHNLATANPGRGRELNQLPDGFLKKTHALIPAKNPDCNPLAKAPKYHPKFDSVPPHHGKVISLRQEIEVDNDYGMYWEP